MAILKGFPNSNRLLFCVPPSTTLVTEPPTKMNNYWLDRKERRETVWKTVQRLIENDQAASVGYKAQYIMELIAWPRDQDYNYDRDGSYYEYINAHIYEAICAAKARTVLDFVEKRYTDKPVPAWAEAMRCRIGR